MTVSTDQLAALAADAYKTYAPKDWEKGVTLGGVEYRIVDQVDGRAGYQGTIYQRKDSGDLIVAHRGTEFDREPVKDGVIADVGMVIAGVNAQSDAAMALTRTAIELTQHRNQWTCQVPSITVTGHSLGGTLAQITAHRFGLKAETFNAYGAAGLTADYPGVDPDIVNHVRATDFVSAASRHIGEVRTYALDEDVRALSRNGYGNDNPVIDVRNPLGVALGVGVRAHFSHNFIGDGATPRGSIINDENAARAAANAEMINDYRGDIRRLHNGLALPRNVVDGIGDAAGRMAGRTPADPAPPSAFAPGQCAVPAAAVRSEPTHSGHPDHAMYQQARRGVDALDAQAGRVPDGVSERLAASVLHGAKDGGLQRIDQVVLSMETIDAPAGQSVFAVQGRAGDPTYQRVQLETRIAIETPVDVSFQRITAINDANAQAPAMAPALEPSRTQAPVVH